MRKRYCLAKLISHTLAHMGKDIHLQRAQLFLRSDFVVKKTFVSKGPGSTTQSAIEIWQQSSSFPCYSQPGKPTQVARAIKNRGAWIAQVHCYRRSDELDHSQTSHPFVLLNTVQGECAPAGLRRGEAGVSNPWTQPPSDEGWHEALAGLRLHYLQSSYHMEGRAACQNTDPGTNQRIIATNPIQRAKTEMSAKHTAWLGSSTQDRVRQERGEFWKGQICSKRVRQATWKTCQSTTRLSAQRYFCHLYMTASQN